MRYDLRHELNTTGPGEDSTARPPSIRVAALMQVLAADGVEMQQSLVERLAEMKDADATRALARLAVFSFEAPVRTAAVKALKGRDRAIYTDSLLAALRYPWPAVAENASAALAQLPCRDVVPRLVALLDEPDPRAPIESVVDSNKTFAVREMVRINHNRGCLLCHAPGNTPDTLDLKGDIHPDIVVSPVPPPGVPLTFPGYGSFQNRDLLVRADVTYLRQDFSLTLSDPSVAPWPEKQRFDFLVRTRAVTADDVAVYRQWLKEQGPAYRPPHQQAVLAALRALTGRDAEPTRRAWRIVLSE
jgi:hypothetical protein